MSACSGVDKQSPFFIDIVSALHNHIVVTVNMCVVLVDRYVS